MTTPLKAKLKTIIFEADTPAGKLFDIVLIGSIFISVLVVMLDSVASLNLQYGPLFYKLEWGFTILFTIEYALRLWIVEKPKKYAFSFFGLIDLFAVIPTYISWIFPGYHYLLIIRLLRVLRIFRVLKLVQYVEESKVLMQGLKESARKIFVFIFAVVILVIILGAIIYSIEGGNNGFTSIPRSIYWAIVTLTTVGYGDIAPATNLGQVLAAVIMLLGYGIIAVPAGIVTSELNTINASKVTTIVCDACLKSDHEINAKFCKHCGEKLNQ